MSPRASFLLRALALFVLLPTALVQAKVEVSLPAQGWFRGGQYMPVRAEISADGAPAGGYLELFGGGFLPTRVQLLGGRAAGVVPVFVYGDPSELRWQIITPAGPYASGVVATPLRKLNSDQNLVATVGPLPQENQQISTLTGSSPITIELDPQDPLPGSPAAWSLLDTLIVSTPQFKLDNSQVLALLSAGTKVALKQIAPPSPSWAWSHLGDYWLSIAQTAGPAGGGENSDAFIPVQGWRGEWPAPYRVQVILFAAVIAILLLAVSLFKSRSAAIVAVLLCAFASAGIALWRRDHTPLLRRVGTILVLGKNDCPLRDEWTYYTSTTAARGFHPCEDLTYPFVEFADMFEGCDLALRCREGGEVVGYEFKLLPSARLAFLSREVVRVQKTMIGSRDDHNTPMGFLAQKIYLEAGETIQAQTLMKETRPMTENIGAVEIDRANR